MKKGYVYILTNKPRGVLYVGVTSTLVQRLDQHYLSEIKSFTKKYRLKRLVYLEEFDSVIEAIAREKQLKRWHRQWKINLIESVNPKWKDLLRDAETSSA
ncbi:MAG: GIY-YIG nuclease family protein [Patescibacteria group bacterium]|jgi:putative endonuclease